MSNPEFGHILYDSLVLASDLRVCFFSHVKRIGNFVAHFLVRHTKSSDKLQVWVELSLMT